MVTLVHGTWAQHTWVPQPEGWPSKLVSRLRRYVREEVLRLPDRPAETSLYAAVTGLIPDSEVFRFCWSGGNSHTKRLSGGVKLRGHLQELVRRYPNGHRFVVAHSHGGSVTLYALKDFDAEASTATNSLSDEIAGVVTLATPYLHINKRKNADWKHDRGRPDWLLTWTTVGAVSAGLLVWVGLAGSSGTPLTDIFDYPGVWWWLVLSVVIAWGTATLAFLASAILFRGLRPVLRNEKKVDEELNRLHHPDIGSGKLHAVFALGDETTGVLMTFQFAFSWIFARYLHLLDLRKLLVLTSFVFGVGLFTSWLLGSVFGLGGWVGDATFNVIAAAAGIALALGSLVAVLGLFLLALGSLPSGWDAPFLSLVSQTTAERLPPGRVEAFQVETPPNPGKLAHSIQTRNEVHEQIRKWIAQGAPRRS